MDFPLFTVKKHFPVRRNCRQTTNWNKLQKSLQTHQFKDFIHFFQNNANKCYILHRKCWLLCSKNWQTTVPVRKSNFITKKSEKWKNSTHIFAPIDPRWVFPWLRSASSVFDKYYLQYYQQVVLKANKSERRGM